MMFIPVANFAQQSLLKEILAIVPKLFARFYHLKIIEIASLYYSVHREPMPGARNALDFT